MATRIKAYSIALDVMERDEDFDNSIDSIVRVEMHRLRKNLSLFNARNSDYKIKIPKASYIPIIVEKPGQRAKTKKPLAFILFQRKTFAFLAFIFASFFALGLTGNHFLNKEPPPLTENI